MSSKDEEETTENIANKCTWKLLGQNDLISPHQTNPRAPAKKRMDNILENIGNTPLVRLNRISKGLSCELYAKVSLFSFFYIVRLYMLYSSLQYI